MTTGNLQTLKYAFCIWAIINVPLGWTQEQTLQPAVNQRLVTLLADAQKNGLPLVFSTQLVKRHWRVWQVPPAGDVTQTLNKVLQAYGLVLEYDAAANTYFVVRDESRPRALTLTLAPPVPIACRDVTLYVDGQWHAYQRLQKYQLSFWVAENAHSFRVHCGQGLEASQNLQAEQNEYSVVVAPLEVPLLEEVLVTANRVDIHSRNSVAETLLDQTTLQLIPLRGNDPVQAIQSVAGVSSEGVSGKPYVQGGESDELLIRLDGVTLYDPFHLKDFYSLYSGINRDIVDVMQFYKGIYPANFGGKLSGVLDITSLQAPPDEPFAISMDAFTTALRWSDEWVDQNHADRRLFSVASFRRGNLNEILDAVNPEVGTPRFNDGFFKARWQSSDATSYTLGLLSLFDDIRLNRSEPSYEESAASRYESLYGWLQWQHVTQGGAQHALLLSASNIKNMRSGTLDQTDSFSGSVGSLTDHKHLDVATLNYELQKSFGEHEFVLSMDINYTERNYDYQANAALGELAAVLGYSQTLNDQATLKDSMLSGATSLALQTRLKDSLQLDLGARHDWQNGDLISSDQLSPRLNITNVFNPHWTIEWGVGRYHQHPGITDLVLEPKAEVVFNAQRSDHTQLNFIYDSLDHWRLTLGGYYKLIKNPKKRLHNLLTQYHFLPELQADRFVLPVDESRLKGVELTLEYDWTRLNARVTYARGEHQDKVNGQWLDRRWQQDHNINTRLSWIDEHWESSIEWVWHSGSRYTDLPENIEGINSLDDVSLYANTLPSYYSVNLNVAYDQQLRHSVLHWYMVITNLTNKTNIGSYSYTLANSDPATTNLSRTADVLLPLIPNIGVQWLF